MDGPRTARPGDILPRVRWDRLFADLEAQAAHAQEQERDAEVAERVRAEWARTSLADRLAAAVLPGPPLAVRVEGVGVLHGALADLGADWLLLHVQDGEGDGLRARSLREELLPQWAVLDVRGLPRIVDPRPGVSMRRFGIGTALRALSRDRASVRVVDRSGATFVGTVDRVGADHLDLAEHAAGSARRRTEVHGVRSLPLQALAAVSRSGR